MIIFGALTPHPPIMVAGIGRPEDLERVAASRAALEEIDRMLAADPPDTLVVFTPHGTVYQDALIIYSDARLTGGLQNFGLDRTWSWATDSELARAIAAKGSAAGLPVYLTPLAEAAGGNRPVGLDHGVLTPLSFFNPAWMERVKLVVIPLSYLSLEELYQFGAALREAVAAVGRKTAVIASGDLSHCLKPGAPAGYRPEGAEFDRKLIELLRREAAVPEFFKFDPALLEKAAECGFRSLIMLLGCFDTVAFQVKVHSYEGPFGVGYGVASLRPRGGRESMLPEVLQARREAAENRRRRETPLVGYARRVVEAYVKNEAMPSPQGLEEFSVERAGVFVSIKKNGQLRGCIGTVAPTRSDVVAEVEQNAISAATRDPRFNPVTAVELTDLVYSVDILKPPEPITGPDELDPRRYGVIVKQGRRKGLLLPKLEGVETVAAQLTIAKRKAGISPQEPVELERFEVVRYH